MRKSSARAVVLTACFLGLLFVLRSDRLAAESPRYAISAAHVAQALTADGIHVTPEEVRLPLPLTAASPSPQLQLVSMRAAAPDSVQMEIRCRNAGECLPFLVLVEVPVGTASSFVADAENHSFAAAGMQPAEASGKARVEGVPAAPERIRAGSHITLLLEDGQMRIQIPAVALDSGTPGFDVRVCTPDHRKTFRAMVVSSTVARGGLE